MNDSAGKRILVVDSDLELCKRLAGYLGRAGHMVKVSQDGAEALSSLEEDAYDLVVTALNLPRGHGMDVLRKVKRRDPACPVVILTSQGSVKTAVEAMKEGAQDFLLKPIDAELLESLASRMLKPRAQAEGGSGRNARQIVTQDARLLRLLDMARTVADSRATVLISGESGTGKELFARFLHENSSRASATFVAVNCASLPEGLLESELFGHEKGAFTGAISRKPGKFELAQGGTILLDEVSEMAPALQAKLLRVLQEGEIDRVGGKRPVPVDVRVVATTNRDLKEHIEKGEFRQDLYYRLNVIPLKIPPLRERPGDVLILAEHFLARFVAENRRGGLILGEAARRQLAAHNWPGNVRELQNTMERAVLLAQGEEITPAALMFDDQLPPPMEEMSLPLSAPPGEPMGLPPTLREAEKLLIQRALGHTEGNRTHAAKMLGISVRTLRNKLNEYKNEHGFPPA